MTTRIWPDVLWQPLDRGVFPWLRDFASDFLGHKQQLHPRNFVELADVDGSAGLSDGAIFVYSAAAGKLVPQLGVPPAAHGASHAFGGTDPIPGGSGQLIVFY